MSDSVNPYRSPETADLPEQPLAAQGALTETMLLYLKGASPWLKFIGILGFVGAGFVVLWGIFYLAAGSAIAQMWREIPGFWVLASGGVGAALGLVLIGSAALFFFPSLFAYRFGEKISSYLKTGAEGDLEAAFKNNKSFWKFCGIMCVIYLAFIPVMIILGIIIGVAGAVS